GEGVVALVDRAHLRQILDCVGGAAARSAPGGTAISFAVGRRNGRAAIMVSHAGESVTAGLDEGPFGPDETLELFVARGLAALGDGSVTMPAGGSVVVELRA